MKKINNINIVALLDIMETNSDYYIVQEFCDGGDLKGY
jgi:calcium-dependent protein kinase